LKRWKVNIRVCTPRGGLVSKFYKKPREEEKREEEKRRRGEEREVKQRVQVWLRKLERERERS
jgi:ribulose 1,5-bisphosphate carboxylase large subunit-like protein